MSEMEVQVVFCKKSAQVVDVNNSAQGVGEKQVSTSSVNRTGQHR